MINKLTIKRYLPTGLVLILAAAVLALAGACSDSVEQDSSLEDRGYASIKRLVTTDWVAENLATDNVVVIDVSKQAQYDEGHIPGALSYPTSELQVERDGVKGLLPAASDIEEYLSGLGVSPDDTIIIYDHIKSLWGSRLLWTLRVYGHDNVRLMDGAYGLWVKEGRDISTTSPSPKSSSYKFSGKPNKSLIVGIDQVLENIGDEKSLVVDTRSADEYSGRDVRAARGGHIPESVHLEWTQNVDEDGRFLSAAKLKDLYLGSDITGDLAIYTLCQTAVRATHSWFVLAELLGYDDVAVYDGSWTEWGNSADTPIDS
jgi:thiosulfate/3-mercaptopyruvate sulfurtransferase